MGPDRLFRRLATTLALAATLAAPAGAQSLRDRWAQRHAEAPGLTALQVTHGDERREVLVHVPAGHDPDRPMPLVLALHGGGGSAAYMADDARYGLNRKADSAGFIVAYPNGHSRFPGGRLATWNAGGGCGDSRDRGIDDVAVLRETVAAIERHYRVDHDRIFAVGMSNGGMMAYRLACEAADLFRAVASVAGTQALARCEPGRPIAILHLHARDDTHVLFDGGAGEDAFRDRSKVMDFPPVPATLQQWAAREHCTAPPQRVLQTEGAYCERYPGCAAGQQVQLCVTDSGGHSWPGAPTTRLGKAPASKALSANDVIWSFFEALPRR